MWWPLSIPVAEHFKLKGLLGPFPHPQGSQDPPTCAEAELSSDEVIGEAAPSGQRGLRWCYSKLVLIT